MEFWVYLLITELMPIAIWVFGAICEKNSVKFNKGLGYRSKLALKNKLTWEYSNKVSSKILGSVGTFLFIMNAIIIISFGLEIMIFVILGNVLIVTLALFIIEKSLRKKFDLSGKIKNN